MKTRVISGIVGVLIAVVAVVNFYTIFFDIAAFAVYAVAVYEICRVFKDGNSKITAVSLWLLGLCVIFNNIIKLEPMIVATAFIAAIVCTVVFTFENTKFTAIASSVAMSLYVLFGVFCISNLKIVLPFSEYGWDAAFMFVLCAGIAWGGDIMAYFSGYLFGKHKMAPKLSPKKTVEGAVGGVLGSIVVALAMAFIYSKLGSISELSAVTSSYITLAIISAIGSCLGIIGDLFASAIKRQSGIKDYGAIMPGHGGVMDRFDSILFVAPVIYLMAEFIAKI